MNRRHECRRERRRQMTLCCSTYEQWRRLRDWALWLGLEWNYGSSLGDLRVGQGVFPMSHGGVL